MRGAWQWFLVGHGFLRLPMRFHLRFLPCRRYGSFGLPDCLLGCLCGVVGVVVGRQLDVDAHLVGRLLHGVDGLHGGQVPILLFVRRIELADQVLHIFLRHELVVAQFLQVERVLESRGQDGHLGVFVERVVVADTPYHIDVGIKHVHKRVDLLHLAHKQWVALVGVDVEEYA